MSIKRSLSSRPGYLKNKKTKQIKNKNFKTKTPPSSKLRPCDKAWV